MHERINDVMNNPTATAGNRKIVLPFFLAAAFYLIAFAAGLLWSPGEITGHYFQPRTLALVHLLVLGFCTMIAMGTLYQLLPVLSEKPLFSSKLAWPVLVLMVSGTLLLSCAFWLFDPGLLMQTGAVLLLSGIALHCINMLFTVRHASPSPAIDCITAAHLWLLVTAVIGTLLVFNFHYLFLPRDQLHYLSLHAHLGIVGWFLLLIIGAASRIIPMLLLSPGEKTGAIRYSFAAINAGLLLFLGDVLLFHSYARGPVYALMIASGLFSFLYFIAQVRKRSMRKKNDEAMRQTFFALVYLFVPVILFTLNSAGDSFFSATQQLALTRVYGISLLAGFLVMLILGQTFKTLPFIIWMDMKSKKQIADTVLPRHLYNARMVSVMFYAWNSGVLLLMFAVFAGSPVMSQLAGGLLVLAAVLYLLSIFLMLRKRTEA